QGWSWNQILPYFQNENWSPPADLHDTSDQFNPGPRNERPHLRQPQWSTFEQNVIQTTQELPDDFLFNLDANSGQPWGVSWLQSTIGAGERSSSATKYLAPEFFQRPNLHVLLHAQVSRLVNVSQRSGKPTFGGVVFRYGISLFVTQKEIILSAGSVGIPKILINSGIGVHSTLSALDMLPTVLDLPSVGQNASDHPSLSSITQWEVNTKDTFASIATRFTEGLAQWNTSRTGPFVDSGVGTHVRFFHLPTTVPAFAAWGDPSAGPGAPHLELTFTPGGFVCIQSQLNVFLLSERQAEENLMTIDITVVSPVMTLSRRHSSGYLSSEFDILALDSGIALAPRFVNASTWSGYIGAMTTDIAGLNEA
ncbi:GMC oxidoreductase-domain-containing protein, partial [Mycena galericulata]